LRHRLAGTGLGFLKSEVQARAQVLSEVTVILCELEDKPVREAMARANGDKTLAARLWGIGKSTLY
jgi:DNA-binding protein Fis